MEPHEKPDSPRHNGSSEQCGQNSPRRTVDEWHYIVNTFRKPLTRIIKPLHILLKSKLNCDHDGRELQEQLLEMDERNIEAAEKLLDFMLKEEGKTEDDNVARWHLFEDALKSVHPVLYEIITGNLDAEIQEQQKGMIDFFMEDISKCVDPMHLLPALYAKHLLEQSQCERLRCLCEQKGPTLGAIFMLCNIHRNNPDWYSTFLGVLIDKDYGELVKNLDEDAYHKKLQQGASSMHRPAPIGSSEAEMVMEAHGAAHNPRPSNHCAAPPREAGGNESPEGRELMPLEGEGELNERRGHTVPKRDNDELNAETRHQTPISRAQHCTDAGSDEEFHSCNSSFDREDSYDPDLTKVKEIEASWDDHSTNTTGNSFCAVDDNSDNWVLTGKQLCGKNILLNKEIPTNPDNTNAEVDNPQGREAEEEIQAEPLYLRDYQEELAEDGLAGKNVIIIAPTGSGKTHVALRIIQKHLEQRGTGVRKVVFLVNQLALAQQQYEECAKYLSDFRVKLVTGSAGGATATEKVPLKNLLMRADVLVLTAQILVNALDQKEIDGICQFSLLVFDECHHTNQQHPFNCIMHHYMAVKYSENDDTRVELPQVVGLTASVGVGKAGNQEQARKHIRKLCAHLDTDFIRTVARNTEQLAQFSNDPKYEQHLCGTRPNDKFQTKIEDIMKIIEEKMERSEYLIVDDADSLKEKLKNKPHVRGTCQYTGWVSELVRSIAMLDNAKARRFFESSRRMLKFYNESLAINDECDTKDALDFLDLQMNEIYDPIGKRATEIDQFLKDLFDKNKPYLDVVSKEQANTNPKLIKLEQLLVKAFQEEPESRAMVFVKTRDLAEALLQWMMRRPSLKRLKPGKIVGTGPSVDKGGMTKHQQVDVMEYFRAGDNKVMIATSVAEEGLDIRKCNLVIRYNHVTNEIAMVQARGRARAENSQFVTLASHDKGVQAKEEVNFIREMMMRDAIKELQMEMRTRYDQFRTELCQIQREEKSKRDAELSLRQGRQLRQGEVVFRCRNCDAYAFVSSDVRKIEHMHHVVKDLDYRLRHLERQSRPETHGQIQSRGKLYCKQCGEEWGPIFLFENVKFPGIRLQGFRLTDEFDRTDIPKKWKQTNFEVQDLEPEELERYRQDAIAVGYI